jgi:hypothetical protein
VAHATAASVAVEGLRSPGRPLEPSVRTYFEPRFGTDLRSVRIHTDPATGSAATAIGARAYAVGEHIGFAPGGYRPDVPSGRGLIAHELAHVLQQGDGARSGTAVGVRSDADPGEHEARSAADTVARGGAASVRRRSDAAPVVSRSPFLLPGVDILPPIQAVGQIATALAASCDHPAPLTWADFQASPPRGATFAAETHFHHELTAAGSGQAVRAVFEPGPSWVQPKYPNAADRSQNGWAPQIANCEQYFDRQAAANLTGGTFWLRNPPGCPAAVAPDRSVVATSRAECDSILGPEADRVAGLESARLLRHEQLHYDLACALARKGTTAILGGSAAASTLQTVRQLAAQLTIRYDNETHNGCIADAQARWDADITAGLPRTTIP